MSGDTKMIKTLLVHCPTCDSDWELSYDPDLETPILDEIECSSCISDKHYKELEENLFDGSEGDDSETSVAS